MLTVLLQVRYHREEGKCRAGAHGPGSQRRCTRSGSGNGSGSNEGNTGGGTNVRRGYERSPRDGKNENERARGECGEYEQVREGSNERRGYKQSPGDGTNENERARGEGGGVRTSTCSMNGAPGMVQRSTRQMQGVRMSAGGYERARGGTNEHEGSAGD